jgi:hypothetical protein
MDFSAFFKSLCALNDWLYLEPRGDHKQDLPKLEAASQTTMLSIFPEILFFIKESVLDQNTNRVYINNVAEGDTRIVKFSILISVKKEGFSEYSILSTLAVYCQNYYLNGVRLRIDNAKQLLDLDSMTYIVEFSLQLNSLFEV